MEAEIRSDFMCSTRKIRVVTVVLSLVVLAGCQSTNNTHTQNKQQMRAKWQKTTSEMRLSAAMEQFDAGRYEQAEAVAKECISSDLNLPDAYLLLGKVRLVGGDFSGAKSSFQTYVNLKQASDEGWFLLGLACERLNDVNAAFNWYQKALEFSPEKIDYVIALGRMYVAQNDFASAEKLYLGKIASNPGEVDLKIAAGQMYLAAGQNDKAVELYEQAHLTMPDNTELLEALGSCYVLAGNWQEAHDVHKQLYQRCTDKTAKNGYLKIMAHCATNAGDYSLAMKYYSQLTVQDTQNAQLWLSMGQAALGADLPRQALICSKKAIALKSDMMEAYLLSGSANYKSGNYRQAIDDFQKVVSSVDHAHFAWLMTARCYEKMGNAEQAKAAYKKAVQFGSDSELQKLLVKPNQES